MAERKGGFDILRARMGEMEVGIKRLENIVHTLEINLMIHQSGGKGVPETLVEIAQGQALTYLDDLREAVLGLAQRPLLKRLKTGAPGGTGIIGTPGH